MNSLLFCFFTAVCFCFLCRTSGKVHRHPVIYIPGDGGSRIEGKIDKEKLNPLSSSSSLGISSECSETSGWHRIWLDVWQLATSSRVRCWASKFKLVHDYKDGKNKNVAGLETRVPGWGETNAVEYIDPSWLAWAVGDAGNVAANLVNHMVKNWGYQRGFDIRGAPYDFRFAPNSQNDFFRKLKLLVEDTYAKTGERVVIFTHSLGGIFGLRFLNSVSAPWKRRFIHAFVPTGAPWAGSAVPFNLYVAGDARGIKEVDPKVIRDEQRSYETGVLLLPSTSLWPEAEVVFAATPTRNYTAKNYDKFFSDLNYPLGKINHDYVKNSTAQLNFPGVSVYCVFSRGVQTPKTFFYSDSGFLNGDQPRRIFYGDGDGTVNLESSQLCRKWARQTKTEMKTTKTTKETRTTTKETTKTTKKRDGVSPDVHVETRMFDGIEHSDLIKDVKILDYLEKIFFERTDEEI